ncbi:zinc finger HIT domain-containing protein 2 [Leptopilina boulardi]|uniref:zinc finger HIT domain-containing protein 2 n=1 Tax=Leptopilina boulardi TaxID=63433 RepID=UPI0021F58748|nr:zinc finger HIT domain-containing protein 2 [Leptopilina boulardi]
MTSLDKSKDDRSTLCSICNENPMQYTCPKCSINYCSLNCYKSEKHEACSELFYKNWVEMEMKVRNYDPENKKKMLDILERLKRETEEPSIVEKILNDEDDCEELDSDDEDGISLEERIANIDLNDVDQLWSSLTNSERQEFEAIIQSNNFEKILPEWIPWWEQCVEVKLVREIDEVPEYEKLCPSLISVPAMNSQMKVSPSVHFNLINVLCSYAYVVLHFYGDHLNSSKLASQVFLYVCENINEKKNFHNIDSAINAVFQRIFTETSATDNEELDTISSIKQATDQIIQGPKDNCSYYVLAALSDLHALFSKARKETSKSTKSQFNKKFDQYKDIDSVDISKKTLQLHLKKLEFYFSWVKLFGKNLSDFKINIDQPDV